MTKGSENAELELLLKGWHRRHHVAFKCAASSLNYLSTHNHRLELLTSLWLQKHKDPESPLPCMQTVIPTFCGCATHAVKGSRVCSVAEEPLSGTALAKQLWGSAAPSSAFELCTRSALWPRVISISPASIFKGSSESKKHNTHAYIKGAIVLSCGV